MFVVFEGIEGSGRGTLSSRVARRFRESGASVEHLREEDAGTPVVPGLREFQQLRTEALKAQGTLHKALRLAFIDVLTTAGVPIDYQVSNDIRPQLAALLQAALSTAARLRTTP
jgi:hypothetical protein